MWYRRAWCAFAKRREHDCRYIQADGILQTLLEDSIHILPKRKSENRNGQNKLWFPIHQKQNELPNGKKRPFWIFTKFQQQKAEN